MVYALIALVVLSPVLALALLSATARRPDKLGVVDGRFAGCPDSPNCVSTQAADDSHRIEPLVFEGTSKDAVRKLKASIATIPRMKVVSETENYIYAEAASLLFRFTDDVEFLIDGSAKVIHFRSASRVGRSDLGANRARMEKIREAFTQR